MNQVTTTAPARTLCQSVLLSDASNVAVLLEGEGIEIFGCYSNGRTVVFLVSEPPKFVKGVMTRREPNGQGGRTRVLAAPYRGMQLEWRVEEADQQSKVLQS